MEAMISSNESAPIFVDVDCFDVHVVGEGGIPMRLRFTRREEDRSPSACPVPAPDRIEREIRDLMETVFAGCRELRRIGGGR